MEGVVDPCVEEVLEVSGDGLGSERVVDTVVI